MTKQFTKWITLSLLSTLIAGNLFAQIYQTGYSSMTFTDPSRGNRQIPAEIFYPADITGTNVPLGSPFDKKYPVIVFGHDEATPYYNYQYTWDRWVRQGFIVVHPLTETGPVMDVVEFAQDLGFIANQFKVMRFDPTSFYYKRHNMKSCVMGHGKGGSAALLAPQYHPLITALVTFAVVETTPSIIAAANSIIRPTVIIAGGDDCDSPFGTVQEAVFNNLASDCKTLMNFTTENRCAFAQNAPNCASTTVICGGNNPYPYQVVNAETAWMLNSFLRYYLKSNAPALAKFEWKMQQRNQKKNDFIYIMYCNQNSPRLEWQPEDAEGEEYESFEAVSVNLYPNPVLTGNDFKLEVVTEFDTKATIMITDLMGKLISKEEVTLEGNSNEITLSTIGISKGAYMVTITGIEGRTTRPLIIH